MKRLLLLTLTVLLLIVGQSFAACTTAFPTSAKAEFLTGVHDVADTYKLAFYTDTATYGAATTAYAATNEVTGTGYTAGGFIVADNAVTEAAPTSATSGTTGLLDFADVTWNTITFDTASTCAVLYNDTEAGDPAIAVFNFSSVQPSAGDLTADFPASGASTSTLQFAQILKYLFGVPNAYAVPAYTNAVVKLPGVRALAGIMGQMETR